jgi:hypothetical protein
MLVNVELVSLRIGYLDPINAPGRVLTAARATPRRWCLARPGALATVTSRLTTGATGTIARGGTGALTAGLTSGLVTGSSRLVTGLTGRLIARPGRLVTRPIGTVAR